MTAHDNSTAVAVNTGPGAGGRGAPLFYGGPRTVEARTYAVTFGSHYPVAGVAPAGVFDSFSKVLQIIPDNISTYHVIPDYTNKKLLLYKAIGTVQDDDTDMSAVTANVTVIGYPA